MRLMLSPNGASAVAGRPSTSVSRYLATPNSAVSASRGAAGKVTAGRVGVVRRRYDEPAAGRRRLGDVAHDRGRHEDRAVVVDVRHVDGHLHDPEVLDRVNAAARHADTADPEILDRVKVTTRHAHPADPADPEVLDRVNAAARHADTADPADTEVLDRLNVAARHADTADPAVPPRPKITTEY